MTFSAGCIYLAKMLLLACIITAVNVLIYQGLAFANLASMPIAYMFYVILWCLAFFIVCLGINGMVLRIFMARPGHLKMMMPEETLEERIMQKPEDPPAVVQDDVPGGPRRVDHTEAKAWTPARMKDINAVSPIFKLHWDKVRFGGRAVTVRHRVDARPATATMEMKMKNVQDMAELFKYHWDLPLQTKTDDPAVSPDDLAHVSPRDT